MVVVVMGPKEIKQNIKTPFFIRTKFSFFFLFVNRNNKTYIGSHRIVRWDCRQAHIRLLLVFRVWNLIVLVPIFRFKYFFLRVLGIKTNVSIPNNCDISLKCENTETRDVTSLPP